MGILPGVGALASMRGGVKIAEVGADAVTEGTALARIAELGPDADATFREVGPPVEIFGKKFGKEGYKIVFGDGASSIRESLVQSLRGGQWVGTKGLRAVGSAGASLTKDAPELVKTLKIPDALQALKTLDQTSGLGRGIDAGVKIVTKAVTVPHQIEKDLKSMADSFGNAVAG